MANHFDLIIFDNDGVLVDSEIGYRSTLISLLQEQGLFDDEQEIFDLIGGSGLVKATEALSRHFDKDLGADFVDRWDAGAKDIFEMDLDATLHIEDVLKQLKKPYCVASGSTLPMLKIKHKTTGLNKLIDEAVLFSSTQVANPKPAPDLFLFAAKQMNTLPEKAVVIEDTVNGVKAAKAAGMYAVGFVGGGHYNGVVDAGKERLYHAGADIVISDMRDLLEIVQ